MKLFLKKLFLLAVLLAALVSCGDDEEILVPKPKGYFRIDFPEKAYTRFDTACPFSFDYPVYASVVPDRDKNSEPCWYNIDYPRFKGKIHLSYKPVDGDIDRFLEDSHEFVKRHIVKAEDIDPQLVARDSAKVYGILFEIKGNTASPLQFHLTDSINHFVRGSLYFHARPNKDSISVVLDFIRKDIHRMIESFEWKEQKAKK
jgi:gliding motility-associated lipoprotein GldD